MAGAVAILIWVALLVGLVLVVRGMRGRPEWSSPTCARCRYELRGLDRSITNDCPECGSNLQQPRAVRFGRYAQNGKLAAVGAIVVLLAGGVLVTPLVQRWSGIRIEKFRSNQSLIAQLGTNASDPRTWQELMDRHFEGKLSDEEIADAVDQVITFMLNTNQSKDITVAMVSRHLDAWIAQERIGPEQFTRLCKACDAGLLNVQAPDRIRIGTPFHFSINSSAWGISAAEQVFAIQSVRLEAVQTQSNSDQKNQSVDLTVLPDGRFTRPGHTPAGPITVSGTKQWGLNGTLELNAPDESFTGGSHELVFTIDVGSVPSHLASFNTISPPGSPDQWPQPIYKDVETIRVPVKVLAADEDVIKLVSPAAQKAAVVASLRVSGLRQEFLHGMMMYRLVFSPAANPPVPLSCKVFVRSEGYVEEIGQFTAQGGGIGLSGFQSMLKGLPRNAQTVDVIFRPNAEAVESQSGWTEIWGEEITIQNVPILRPADSKEMDRQAIRNALQVGEVRLGGRIGTRVQGPGLNMGHSPLPMPVRMRVIIRRGDFEREIGSVSENNGQLVKVFPMQPVEDFPADATTADVIFRPDQGGVSAEHWRDFWTEDVVITNVPVIRTTDDNPR